MVKIELKLNTRWISRLCEDGKPVLYQRLDYWWKGLIIGERGMLKYLVRYKLGREKGEVERDEALGKAEFLDIWWDSSREGKGTLSRPSEGSRKI